MADRSGMHVRPYEGGVVGKIVIGRIKTEMGISDGRTRHVDGVNNLLKKTRGEVLIRVDVVNDEGMEWGKRKVKRTAYLTKRINKSPDKQLNHMITNK